MPAEGEEANGVDDPLVLGYTTATRHELDRLLQARRIPDAEIDQALAALSCPDPAGVTHQVSREEVMRVAVHMNLILSAEGTTQVFFSPEWSRGLVGGHPGAHAIFQHEREEIAAFARLGIPDPGRLRRSDPRYFEAHALACWREAEYWERWARAEGRQIPAAAFLQAHPLRPSTELNRVRALLLSVWSISVPAADRVELDEARRFYATKSVDRRSLR